MSYTVTEIKEHLTPMLHGGTLKRVRNFEAALQRAALTMMSKVDLLETIRSVPLTQTVHSELFKYALPTDFRAIVDLFPQEARALSDKSVRQQAQPFDLRKALDSKTLSIESADGAKFIKINWRIRSAKTLHTMNSYNGNGTWSAVGSASNIVTDTIYKYSGGGSVRFDSASSGDGIQVVGTSAVDATDEDEVGNVLIMAYFGSVTELTSVTFVWGNDITANYWTSVAVTTQADGTALRAGWNVLSFPWSTATETGTVDPANLDSFKVTAVTTAPISDIRIDNILLSIGYPFEIKYYSKFLFRNTAGTWINKPSSDDDVVLVDDDSLQIFLLECVIAMAQQMEATDSVFDINFAKNELPDLYRSYKGEHPSQAKKTTQAYSSLPRFRR